MRNPRTRLILDPDACPCYHGGSSRHQAETGTAPEPSAEKDKAMTTPTLTTITRTGFPPLRFNGTDLAYADTRVEGGETQNRWVEVTLFKTSGGKYVARVARKSQWRDEDTTIEATVYADAAALIQGLRNDEGRLGRASQEALERAAGLYPGTAPTDDGIAAAYVETVD